MRKCFFAKGTLYAVVLAGVCIAAPAHAAKVQYPKAVAMDFVVFKTKCIGCHTLKRAIVTEEVLPSQVNGLIDRMAAMDDADISSTDKLRIYNFMVYDMAHRRKTELDAALNALSDSQRQAEQARIDEVLNGYKQKAMAMKAGRL